MKDEYILYLDESEFKLSKTFAIAGIAIKKENICWLEQGMEEVKKIIWGEEYITSNHPVLHCTELQTVYTNRNSDDIIGLKDEYQELIKLSAEDIEKIYHQVYGKLSQVLKKADVTVFSCIIKQQQLYDLFFLDENHNGIHLIDDKYNIALQKIIENFTHYLSVNDGYGDVVYESRNANGENSAKSPDVKLINDYHKIQANNKGIVYTDSTAVQNRNRTIVAYSKSENLAGLQLADFVAYNIIKLERCNVEQQITDFMKQIHRRSYNGGHAISEKDQRSFWGMRVLPSYLRMEELISANKSLKNAYGNIKKERNRLKKIVENNEERIKQLEEQVETLKIENEKLIETDKKC
jgi:hypothetical protein